MINIKNVKYNLIDYLLLFSGVIITITFSIIYKSPWYIYINILLGLIYVFTQAKGQVATMFLGVVYFCFYIYITYSNRFYGEAILYSLVMLPMYIYGIIHWLKNKNNDNNIVVIRKNLSKKEWLCFGIAYIIISIGSYFLLKALNTEELIVSTLSFITMIPAVYLLARRHKWNHIGFLVNDFIVPILWLTMILKGSTVVVPLFVYHFFQIIYDIYGLINWVKIEKQQ